MQAQPANNDLPKKSKPRCNIKAGDDRERTPHRQQFHPFLQPLLQLLINTDNF
jgi:hypothetical protein